MNLTILRERRTRGDMIQQFKISNGLDKVNWARKPMIFDGRVGRRPQRLRREMAKNCAQRHNFYNNRIVCQHLQGLKAALMARWWLLPQRVLQIPCMDKPHLVVYLFLQGLSLVLGFRVRVKPFLPTKSTFLLVI